MNQAIIYTRDNCQECERARTFLNHLRISFLEYKLEKDYTENEFYSEFGINAQYPQISFGIKHIGSLKETLQFFKNKKLF